jgi:hypothetical protein
LHGIIKNTEKLEKSDINKGNERMGKHQKKAQAEKELKKKKGAK